MRRGKVCRIMRDLDIRAVGVDPTTALLDIARTRDPGGDYRFGRAEALDELGGHFDLVVSYLSLIDIPDLATGLQQIVAALRPGGTLLIANLNSFNTAAMPGGWTLESRSAARQFMLLTASKTSLLAF
ncbi:MAG: class I SAM-dependent methyltransferase [Janthinobacterium lividum]